ncbi:MAG: hypothetical protein PHG24_02760 [Candidatus Pacebacteria bacterium]|nr:hypothetical protein [Candidatus Paceibacterota bacterium]
MNYYEAVSVTHENFSFTGDNEKLLKFFHESKKEGVFIEMEKIFPELLIFRLSSRKAEPIIFEYNKLSLRNIRTFIQNTKGPSRIDLSLRKEENGNIIGGNFNIYFSVSSKRSGPISS